MKTAAWMIVAAWIAVPVLIGSVTVFIYLVVGVLRGGPPPLIGFVVSIVLANLSILILRLGIRAHRKNSLPSQAL